MGEDGKLTIYMTEDLISDNWEEFRLIFKIDVTNPTNLLGSTTIYYNLKEAFTEIDITQEIAIPEQFMVVKPEV